MFLVSTDMTGLFLPLYFLFLQPIYLNLCYIRLSSAVCWPTNSIFSEDVKETSYFFSVSLLEPAFIKLLIFFHIVFLSDWILLFLLERISDTFCNNMPVFLHQYQMLTSSGLKNIHIMCAHSTHLKNLRWWYILLCFLYGYFKQSKIWDAILLYLF